MTGKRPKGFIPKETEQPKHHDSSNNRGLTLFQRSLISDTNLHENNSYHPTSEQTNAAFWDATQKIIEKSRRENAGNKTIGEILEVHDKTPSFTKMMNQDLFQQSIDHQISRKADEFFTRTGDKKSYAEAFNSNIISSHIESFPDALEAEAIYNTQQYNDATIDHHTVSIPTGVNTPFTLGNILEEQYQTEVYNPLYIVDNIQGHKLSNIADYNSIPQNTKKTEFNPMDHESSALLTFIPHDASDNENTKTKKRRFAERARNNRKDSKTGKKYGELNKDEKEDFQKRQRSKMAVGRMRKKVAEEEKGEVIDNFIVYKPKDFD